MLITRGTLYTLTIIVITYKNKTKRYANIVTRSNLKLNLQKLWDK